MNDINVSYAGEGIYRENIMDHYKNPRNAGTLENPTLIRKEFNPICGDEITIHISINENVIEDIRFSGKGCAISQAAASMLTSKLKGKTKDQVIAMQQLHVIELLGIKIGPLRMKCAMLCLIATKNALMKTGGNSNG